MTDPLSGSMMIEGRVSRRASGELRIEFRSGPGDPIAVAEREESVATGRRFPISLGRTKSRGDTHVLTYSDGYRVRIESSRDEPTVLKTATGTRVGLILVTDTATAISITAGTICHFVPHPEEPRTGDVFRLLILDVFGAELGRLSLIRSPEGWGRRGDELADNHLWWDRAGDTLPVPILGTRLAVGRRLDRDERDALLAACVDIALGLRPYITELKCLDG
ncbi:hypothetical protein NDR87_10590 [Nocardia sp. CDC159]|uniref:Uncharacterized protein n=1 Tax=Nocardia pulmonis TaxID=2951408 RepID=A0A9X2IVH7_9NOCA|nr:MULTISPECIES: hypothetical protein [Nocardia]MCM6773917.1 hypothetical protein [Nocardia pulmonis]MCM6786804.1 hypothetical protein [Nocardia sp. CDC159]